MASPSSFGTLRKIVPGLFLCGAVALVAVFAAPLLKSMSGGRVALPDMVVALIFGILCFSLAQKPAFQPGITYAVKTLLRYAIALLGLRIAFSDIAALGLEVALWAVGAMAITLASGLLLARWLGQAEGVGVLAGAANAVCGASATLATATVLPDYKTKSADIAFTVVMANAISTLAMLAYPLLCQWMGFSERETGILLGLAIQDMAQVVGAAYAVSEPVGNTAVIVKLFRVLLLLPVVLAVGWYYARRSGRTGAASVPVPGFAIAFIGLATLNSILPYTMFAASYLPIKAALVEISRWGMLIAIAALGLGTSIAALLSIGWRHIAIFLGAGTVILGASIAGILVLG